MDQKAEIALMFFLSLWKVYIAYTFFALKSYSFFLANAFVFSSVVSSYFISFFAFDKLQNKKWFVKFRESKNYAKGVNFYNKYGFYPSLLLAPVLLGIPIFCLVSYALKISNTKVFIGLMLSTLFWGGIVYSALHFSKEIITPFKQLF